MIRIQATRNTVASLVTCVCVLVGPNTGAVGAWQLLGIGNEASWRERKLRELKSDDVRIRRDAVQALGRADIDGSRLIDALIPVMRDDDLRVRRSAIVVLRVHGVGRSDVAITFRNALAGATLAWACECDADAAETYRRNFGFDPTDDVTTVSATDVPDHDVLCAGFPCQSFSVEGRRQGMADPRGRLFYEIVRLLTAKRPMAFLLENVPHLLRIDGGRTFAAMRKHLTGLGYSVRHAVLDARHFGLPQRRERLFIVGILGSVPQSGCAAVRVPGAG